MITVHYHPVVLYVIEVWYKIWVMTKFIAVSILILILLNDFLSILGHYKVRSNEDHRVEIEKSAKYMDLFVCPVSGILHSFAKQIQVQWWTKVPQLE